MLKPGLPLIKNVIKPLARFTAAATVADAGIHKKILGSGRRHSFSSASHNTTTLIIFNNEMKDIIKIVKSLEDSDLLLKGLLKQFKMKQKNKKEDFLVCFKAH